MNDCSFSSELGLIAYLYRNRLFTPDSLPRRPQITRLPPQNQSTQTSQNSSGSLKSQHPSSEGCASSAGKDVTQLPRTGPQPQAQPLTPAEKKPPATIQDEEEDGGLDGEPVCAVVAEQLDERRLSRASSPDRVLDLMNSTSKDSMLGDSRTTDDVDVLVQDSVNESSRNTPAIDDKFTGSKTTADLGSQTVAGLLHQSSASQHRNISEVKRRDKSPLVLAPISTTADPQSSPASTNGPGSSNTPDPTPASPTTSPGDDGPPALHRSFDLGSKADDVDVDEPRRENVHHPPVTTEPSPAVQDGESFLETSAEATQDVDMLRDDQSLKPLQETTSLNVTAPSGSVPSPGACKPPIRIDTRTGASSEYRPKGNDSMVESPLPMTASATPRRAPAPASTGQSPHKRETRIASGALERRSVSDILGETPKSTSPYIMKSLHDSPISASNRDSIDLTTSQGRLADREKREKERSKLSTVVFAKPQSGDLGDSVKLSRHVSGEDLFKLTEPRDYLHTLFESKAYSPPRSAPLASLLQSAHKTLSTADHLIEYQEQMNCRTLKRVYQLQNANRWPLRQMKRTKEPVRGTSHWDFLLDHAKWLRTDFREERKWKLAAARGVAEWCSEWYASNAKERLRLQVKVRPPKLLPNVGENDDVDMDDQPGPAVSTHPTPDLVASAEEESISDGYIEDPTDLELSHAPAAIFSLGSSDFSYPIYNTPAAAKLLNELPLYEPTGLIPDMSKSDLAERSDAKWLTDIVAVSRFTAGKLRIQDSKPKTKRSRYNYEPDSPPRKDKKDTSPLPPEQSDVALFMLENKHIRDRIHPGHSFRPPSEHPMPSQAFFESRSSSQWTHTEDDELRRLVKDYSYNWSLISSCLAPRSQFVSGADRRTPWECFERWAGLEGLPMDMLKTPYFRAYHSRIEAAGRHVLAQQEAAQRQAGNNAQAVLKKRTTNPVRVERKRNQKHLAMLDAMRKLAKKRETALQKQQHANDLAAMRKVNEANQPRPPISTPAEFSRLKHEREIKMAERQELYRQQVLAHQRTAMQQRTAQQMAQGNSVPNGARPSSGGLPTGTPAGTAPMGMTNGTPAPNGQPNQQRVHPSMQSLPNGMMPNAPIPANMMSFKGMSPAQVQASMASRGMAGHSPEQMMRIQRDAALIQQQQQMLAVQARQSQNGNPQNAPHSSPSMVSATMANGNHNAAHQFAASNGAPSPAVVTNGNAGSPRMVNGSSMGQALSSGHTPAISQLVAEVQARHPEMAPEEVQRQATQRLNQYQKQQAMHAASGHSNAVQQAQRNAMNQAALNAAAGAVNSGMQNGNNAYPRQTGMMTNEQAHAFHQARQVQQLQQNGGGMQNPMGMNRMPNGGPGMVNGMTASPVLNMARPVSQHSRSATPREQRSGSINGAQGSPGMNQQGMQT